MNRLIAALLIGAVAVGAWGQERAGADQGDGADAGAAGALGEPVPYERSEFPEWAHALRRAEVVAIGSLPLTLFGVRLLYDFTRYAAHGFAPEVRPFPLRPIGGGAGLTETEMLGIVIGAAALSVAIALIDADMHRIVREDVPDR
jgi:hypothetical protein